MNVVGMLKNLIRWAAVTAPSADDKDFPTHQVTYMGKNADALSWFPYGYHANPIAGSLALMMAVNGNPENRVMFPGSPKERNGVLLPTPLALGEVLIFNPITQAFMHLKINGDIDIQGSIGDINIKTTTGNINIETDTGNIIANAMNAVITTIGLTRISAGGAVDIDATGLVTLDSGGKTTITGNGTVKIDGKALLDLVGTLVEASNGGAVQKLLNETFLATYNAHKHVSGTAVKAEHMAVVDTDTTVILKGE